MGRATPSRRAAFEVLRGLREGQLLDRVFPQAAAGLDARDVAWVRELVYGTVRLRGRLDWMLATWVKGGLDRLDPPVLDILRLGAYQLTEMGSVPAYAAVSQSVDLSREVGVGRASGLVNGVLQKCARGWREVAYPAFDVTPIDYLVTWGSHPRWLVERWVGRWGPAEVQALVDANNTRPDLYLTPLGVSGPAAVEMLRAGGVSAHEVDGFPWSIRISPPAAPAQILALVPAVVQDPAAASVVRFVDAAPGALVIDVSAAPGGKALGMTRDADFVAAADLSPKRLGWVRDNAARLGAGSKLGLVAADGRYPPFRPAIADVVLLDAPCTGTGTFRRHPDGRWRVTPDDLEALSTLQRQMLDASAPLVKVGGTLIYATCSLEPEENQLQTEAFLERHSNYRLLAPPETFDGTMLVNGQLTILPQRHGVDGAYAARLTRLH